MKAFSLLANVFADLGDDILELRFGHQYMFQDLESANRIYQCLILSVGREARGKGLGTELMKRSYEIAKQVCLKFKLFVR